MRQRRWLGFRDPLRCVDQVANMRDDLVDLTPASDVPAQDVEEAWKPLASGQEVPLLWERVYPEELDECRTR